MRRLTGAGNRSPSDGFTLIEIILAMFITVVVMASLLGVLVSSLKTVAQSRQRQTATALATQTLERLRALPYDSITGADPATYPLSSGLQGAVIVGTTASFTPASGLLGTSEALLVNQYSGKRSSKSIDGVTYAEETYVTKAPLTAALQQAFNLTSIVSWTSSVYPTTRTTAQRSTAYSPAGCLSTAQHPFAAPCQAYFTAQAGQSSAGFAVTNADDSKLDIPGFAGRSVELTLPVLTANLQIEQTASGSANAATSGARSVAGTSTMYGASGALVSVDSDPSSTPAQLQQKAANQAAGSATLTGALLAPAGTLIATPTSGDAGGTAAAIAADSTTCADGDPSGTGLITGSTGLRPCASARMLQGGAPGQIGFTSLANDSVSVLSLGASPTTSRAVAAHLATANGLACVTTPGASPPGCAHSKASRSLGTLVIGSPSTGSGPLDVTKGLFRVTGLSETAVAERGVGAGAPGYTRAGSLTVWTSAGYTDIDLATFAAPPVGSQPASQTWTTPAVTTTYPSGLTVTAQGTVTVQRPQQGTSGPADCKVQACVARVSGAGGLQASTTFTVTAGAASTKFVLISNLGGLVAQSTYTAAPDA